MGDRKSKRGHAASSREGAEALPGTDSRELAHLSPEAASKLVHELRVYQAELQAQNEELRRAQDELRASESSYHTLFNAADEALFVHDMATGEILDVNPAMCAMYGVTPEEARRMSVADLSSGEPGFTNDDADRQFAKAMRDGRSVFEWHARRKSGDLFWVEVSLRPVVVAGHGRILAAVRDVTERKRTQEELRRQHDFTESLIETAQAIVLVLDPQGRIVRFNPYMEELCGYPLSEVRDRSWFDAFLPQRERERIRGVFAQSVRDARTRGNVNSIMTKDGRERLIEWYDRALKDGAGNVVGVVAIGHDITDRQQAEEALRRAHDELESRVADRTKELATANARLREEIAERQRSESRERQLQADLAHVGRLTTMGEMASGLAHELNQPLAAIVLQSEVITRMAADRGAALSPDLIKSLEFITKQSLRAGDLIRRMRGFVRHAAPKRAMVTMAEVVDEVLALVQRDLRASGIALELKIEDPQADLEADKVQLQQVLLNLIRNAIEAMENTEADRRRLCIERRVHDQLVEVAVRDSGHGIAADNADNLFKAFYSTKAEGMGMGLAICRSIIESHGGRIWATPNPDQGSTFTFTLPIATEDGENGTETSRIPGRR